MPHAPVSIDEAPYNKLPVCAIPQMDLLLFKNRIAKQIRIIYAFSKLNKFLLKPSVLYRIAKGTPPPYMLFTYGGLVSTLYRVKDHLRKKKISSSKN
jgi:hypothetical protein